MTAQGATVLDLRNARGEPGGFSHVKTQDALGHTPLPGSAAGRGWWWVRCAELHAEVATVRGEGWGSVVDALARAARHFEASREVDGPWIGPELPKAEAMAAALDRARALAGGA